MTMHPFNLNTIDPSWNECLETAIRTLDQAYLDELTHANDWLPGRTNIFSAFSLPLEKVNYVLFGESPYPRSESANGYAFWDAAVDALWSPTGLSKKVNRATSMRNILKMLLIAEDLLPSNQSTQEAIASIDKSALVQTNQEFFGNLLDHGFLLLNTTPVLRADSPQKDARAWYPFTQVLLQHLLLKRPQIKLIMLGRIATMIDGIIKEQKVEKLYAEHPYNISFITNNEVISFFQPLHLLRKT